MASLLQQSDAYLRALSVPFATKYGLVHLPDHFPLLVYTAVFYTFLHVVVAPVLSPIFAPVAYAKLKGRRGRNNWCVGSLTRGMEAPC